MSLVYVTGAAGTGKSALAVRLREMGIAAYDEDDPEVGSAHHVESGLAVAVPPAAERDSGWFKVHEWRVLIEVLKEIVGLAQHYPVVLCGNSLTDAQIADAGAVVVYLDVDESTLRSRRASRDGNDYGKKEDELTMILDQRRELGRRFATALQLDAGQELDAVVDGVLDALLGAG